MINPIKPATELVTPRELYEAPILEKEIVDAFEVTSRPMEEMLLPEEFEGDRAAKELAGNLSTVFLEAAEKEDCLQKLGRVKKAFAKLKKFAKDHPFLTAGMIIGFLLIVGAGHFVAIALAAKIHITLFHAHIAVGGVIGIMGIYYGVYLINMYRRQAKKDDIEYKIIELNQLVDKVTDIAKKQKGKPTARMASYKEAARMKLTQVKEQIEVLHEKQAALLSLWSKHETKAGPLAKKMIQKQIKANGEALKRGAQLLLTMTDPEMIPERLVLQEEIEIPKIPTERANAIAKKQMKMKEKLKIALQGIKPFIKENPGSAALIFLGIAITIIAGVGAYFYLHGAANIYFFGSISLMTLGPLFAYGLSMIYEGYNSKTINDLKREKERITEDIQKRGEAFKKIDAMQKDYKAFKEDWKAFLGQDVQKRTLDVNRHREDAVAVLIEATEASVKALSEELGVDVPQIDIQDHVEGLVAGAQALASTIIEYK